MAQIRAFSYITLQHGQVGKGRQKMADFTVIETQEQFDAAIKDRLNREKAKFTWEYISHKCGFYGYGIT